MVKALVFLPTGFEEIETSTIVDVLRRSGVEVTVVGLGSNLVEGAHALRVAPDKSIDEVVVTDFDAVVCPGGAPGFENLRRDRRVINFVKEAFAGGKIVAAVCGSPVVLSDAGILKDKDCTVYPGLENELKKGGGRPRDAVVVVDGNVITSRGPATTLVFALKLAEKLMGKEAAKKVRTQTLADTVLDPKYIQE